MLSSEILLLLHALSIAITMLFFSMCGERHELVEVDSAGSMECLGHGPSTRIWTVVSDCGHFIFCHLC